MAYSNGYTYRREITLDSTYVYETISHFVVLVKVVLGSAKVSDSNGYDIIFTNDSDTQLDHYIRDYDSSTGTLWAYVRIPSLSSSSDTTIRVYYYNTSVTTSQEDEANTFNVASADFDYVWHYNVIPDADITSGSTNRSATLNSAGSMVSGDAVDTSDFGSVIDFDASDDEYSTGVGDTTFSSGLVMFFVAKHNDASQSDHDGLFASDASSTNGSFQIEFNSRGYLGFLGRDNGGSDFEVDIDDSPDLNWHLFALRARGGTNGVYGYLDGVETDNDTTQNFDAIIAEFNTGRNRSGASHWGGQIAEIWTFNADKTANFIKTYYESFLGGNLVSIGDETQFYEVTYNDSVTASDSISKQAQKNLTDTLTAVLDTITKQVYKNVVDTPTATDSIAKSVDRSLTDTAIATDSFSYFVGKVRNYVEAVTASDTFSRIWSTTRTFTDSVTVVEAFEKLRSIDFTDVVSVIDSIRFRLNGLIYRWFKQARNATSWSKDSKPSDATWAKGSQPTSIWDKIEREDY